MERIMISEKPEDTFKLGVEMGKAASAGQVYTLGGDLGAGKTLFSQGFAKGLGIDEPVSSPTFNILKIYEGGRIPLAHFDVYRIADEEEMFEIGWDDYVSSGHWVCLIEWPDIISTLIDDIPEEHLVRIHIERDADQGFNYRRITLSTM